MNCRLIDIHWSNFQSEKYENPKINYRPPVEAQKANIMVSSPGGGRSPPFGIKAPIFKRNDRGSWRKPINSFKKLAAFPLSLCSAACKMSWIRPSMHVCYRFIFASYVHRTVYTYLRTWICFCRNWIDQQGCSSAFYADQCVTLTATVSFDNAT